MNNSKKNSTLSTFSPSPQNSELYSPLYSNSRKEKQASLELLHCECKRNSNLFSFYRGQGCCREHGMEIAASFVKDKQEMLLLAMFRHETLIQCQ